MWNGSQDSHSQLAWSGEQQQPTYPGRWYADGSLPSAQQSAGLINFGSYPNYSYLYPASNENGFFYGEQMTNSAAWGYQQSLLGPYVVPQLQDGYNYQSDLFQYDRILALEFWAFPDFFTGQNPLKTPDTYATIRNYLVNFYQLDPSVRLTPELARSALLGVDLSDADRMQGFLEFHGLINYCLPPTDSALDAGYFSADEGSGASEQGYLANYENDYYCATEDADLEEISISYDDGSITFTEDKWFDYCRISDLEMWAIPDCFSGQFPLKTLKSYVALRNAIIHLYMEFPQSYLNVTSIVYSEMFEAFRMWDHWDVVRIHAFLEHWGIINFANDGHLLAKEFVPEKKTEMVGKYSPVRRQELLPLKDRGLNRVDLNVYRRIHGIPEYRGLDAMPHDVLYGIYGFCDIATRGKLHRVCKRIREMLLTRPESPAVSA